MTYFPTSPVTGASEIEVYRFSGTQTSTDSGNSLQIGVINVVPYKHIFAIMRAFVCRPTESAKDGFIAEGTVINKMDVWTAYQYHYGYEQGTNMRNLRDAYPGSPDQWINGYSNNQFNQRIAPVSTGVFHTAAGYARWVYDQGPNNALNPNVARIILRGSLDFAPYTGTVIITMFKVPSYGILSRNAAGWRVGIHSEVLVQGRLLLSL